ncbi:FUSC family protein [Commensalibacter papalotli (ex Botero et al. 2024)]|uniref:Uncharacterized membrane protein YccC (YccC) n=1 Tax=Commensalibacter papalotli (ex Botero et al. 2024) TaxID=2972766 RepID=A0ABM9HL58_9PROT|nr:FUSC family protein [Commensalibacter papalotli (ex Botero et al. 2024)]CAI3931207.1 Uncharacterized membrane protein YccC (YccC) [Commensalibacter papalotli (ex Botero et al. 2024)]CAI3947486.1 Uncharacterized membrane protein YccC (YccC) [Commensalibacter papalotli (ex Botero et al. 2024)]
MNLSWLRNISFFPFGKIQSYQWLYAPRKEAIYFALRTMFASYLALAIALWMQLDSPKWAMMTVWVVAQTSPGETISKSKWRVMGTLVGVVVAVAIVAAFPQQPLIFDICIALWVGGCCFWGSLIRGSSAYSFVLAGYTCALIALSSSTNPNEVFMMAMARGSYIILGVLCQTFVERLFAFNMNHNARISLHNNLLKAITGSLTVIRNVIKGDYQAAFEVQNVFAAISAFQNSIEFRKIEMLNDDHTTDHVHATLFSISVVLTRLINLAVYMRHFQKEETFRDICVKIHVYLENLIHALEKNIDFNKHLDALSKLRWECRQIIVECIYKDTNTAKNTLGFEDQTLLDQRILYRSLSELLGEIEVILTEYHHVKTPKKKDNFRFNLPPIYNFKLAWGNAFRAVISILGACFLWEITAWNEFPAAIGLLAVACGRLCLFENGYKMCQGFFIGTLITVIVTAVLNVTVMPMANSIEMVYLATFIPLFCGGLAIYNLPTRGIGMSFTVFFPFMIILGNQQRMDEMFFLNSALAVFFGVGLAAFAFRFIAPYSPQKVRKEIRKRMLRNVQTLPLVTPIPRPRRWLTSTMDWFISLMRQFDSATETALIKKYNHGALAVMCIGINIIEIRAMIDHDILPEDIKNQLRVVMRRISHFKGGRYGRTVLIAKSAIRRLRAREKKEQNIAVRLEISAAIACLILIYYALEKNASFLNPSYRLYKLD